LRFARVKSNKWTFQDKTGTPANGIVKLIIQDP
jgi:hypothetical protein